MITIELKTLLLIIISSALPANIFMFIAKVNGNQFLGTLFKACSFLYLLAIAILAYKLLC